MFSSEAACTVSCCRPSSAAVSMPSCCKPSSAASMPSCCRPSSADAPSCLTPSLLALKSPLNEHVAKAMTSAIAISRRMYPFFFFPENLLLFDNFNGIPPIVLFCIFETCLLSLYSAIISSSN